jgi:hypothetical protein
MHAILGGTLLTSTLMSKACSACHTLMISLHICSSSFAAVLPAVFLTEDLERRLNTIEELEEEQDVTFFLNIRL